MRVTKRITIKRIDEGFPQWTLELYPCVTDLILFKSILTSARNSFHESSKRRNGEVIFFQDPLGHYYMKFNWKLQKTKTKMSRPTAKNRNHTRSQIQIGLSSQFLSVHLLYVQLL